MGHFEGYRRPELVPKKYFRGGDPFSVNILCSPGGGASRKMGSASTGTKIPTSYSGFLALIGRVARAPQEKNWSSRNGNASFAEITVSRTRMPPGHRTNLLRCDPRMSLLR
jgi:hypothetical protein